MAISAVTQLGPVVTVPVVAGAGATAVCADLGARTIRGEIDVIEGMGIDPVHRLVVPRVIAATLMSTLLNGLVIIVGLVGCYRGLTARGGPIGLGRAVNETVVLSVVALFAVDAVLTGIGVRFGTRD